MRQVPVHDNIVECHNEIDSVSCHDSPAVSYRSPLKSTDNYCIKTLSDTMNEVELNDHLNIDNINIDAVHNVNFDALPCRYSIADNHKTFMQSVDNYSVVSLSSNLRELENDDDSDFDEEQERINFEIKLMLKKTEALEKRSRMLNDLKKCKGVRKHSTESETEKGLDKKPSLVSRAGISRDIEHIQMNSGNGLMNYVNGYKEGKIPRYPTVGKEELPERHRDGSDLPKVELPKYDGNILRYWSFIRQFETQVEGRTRDPGHRMLHLMNCCIGEARDAIEGCIILPPDEGYAKARELLKRLFGRCHVVSRKLIEEVIGFPRISKYNTESLTKLYVKMTNCWTSLSQMNYLADLNSMNTLQQIADKFYEELNDRWVRETCHIYESGREPEFTDMMEFINQEAVVAQSSFAERRITHDRSKGIYTGHNPKNEWKPSGTRVDDRQRATSSRVINLVDRIPETKEERLSCLLCKEPHVVAQCDDYLRLSISDRWEAIKTNGGCFSCLGAGHVVKDCRNRQPCGTEGCGKRHHPSLHRESNTRSVMNSVRNEETGVSLGVMPVRLSGPKRTVTIYALLDSGANTTLLTKDALDKVGIVGVPTEIKINTINGRTSMKAVRCDFLVQATDMSDNVQVTGAFAVERLPVRLSSGTIDYARRWPHLAGIPASSQGGERVEMIIGCDQPKAHWVKDVRLGNESQPFGIKTPLGWIVLGPMQKDVVNLVNHIDIKEDSDGDSLEDMVTQLYNNEFGDLGSNEKDLSRDEREAVRIVTEGTTKSRGQYVVPLPWKMHPPGLPNNRQYALKRLSSLKRRFQSCEGLIGRYHEILKGHLSKGFIAKVSTRETESDQYAWYIPHHPVFNPRKPDKLRIVFDCAAKYRDRSINDCLYQGPDTIANLVGVLLRFRRLPVVLMADIEEMFLQVRLTEEDQPWMQFLWWKDGELDGEIETFKMLVHPFGARSSPFCANFALRQAILDSAEDMSSQSINIANRNIYVDDCIVSVRDVDEAKTVMTELTTAMKKGGFRLRKWLSNKKEVLNNVPTEDLANKVQLLVNKELPVERTLGVEWDAERDQLLFTFQDNEKPDTRRGVLSTIASVFDPLGLISPILMKAKILLQLMCKAKLNWDQQLGEGELKRWREWKGQMQKLKLVSFPRCVRDGEVPVGKMQLHIFADASELGYGAVAYTRMAGAIGYQCRIVMSKARVAPLKVVTIPRLELSAAVLAVRLCKAISKDFDEEFESIHYWTDSVIVLRYIHNTTARFATFVANRVQEILESTKLEQWRHVRSELNPADYASRGLSVCDPGMQLWINGPDFLRLTKEEWPVNALLPVSEEGLETRRIMMHIEREADTATDLLLRHYSDWFRLKKAVAWYRRFASYLRVMKGSQLTLKVGRLSVDEIEQAEKSLLRFVQRSRYPREFTQIVDGVRGEGKVDWRTSELRKLCPRERDGLLVVDSRLRLANIPDAFKFPIILPKEHEITTAIIMYYHQHEGHSGTSHILAKIRERFWVTHGATTVKRTLRKCLRCRILNATSMKQKMAPLPIQRVDNGWYPFQYTGLDYFGPFQVKRGRRLERRYGCLFTCLQCRAVHLEVAQSLSTDSFVLALKRFINRRGVPKEIMSDNGGNFVGAEKELKDWITCLDQNKIVECMTVRSITWRFNPPVASHRGGIWERMIRTTRKILNSVAWRQSIDEEMLWTYLTEAERIINDRPLTAVLDGTGETRPLRPNDLLQPKSGECIVISSSIKQVIEKRWRVLNNLVEEFWKRWRTEYLVALHERHKWTDVQKELAVGDLVIIEAESTPRTYWPMGIVAETRKDGDDLVRTVNIRTASGIVKRDIRKVYRLECGD